LRLACLQAEWRNARGHGSSALARTPCLMLDACCRRADKDKTIDTSTAGRRFKRHAAVPLGSWQGSMSMPMSMEDGGEAGGWMLPVNSNFAQRPCSWRVEGVPRRLPITQRGPFRLGNGLDGAPSGTLHPATAGQGLDGTWLRRLLPSRPANPVSNSFFLQRACVRMSLDAPSMPHRSASSSPRRDPLFLRHPHPHPTASRSSGLSIPRPTRHVAPARSLHGTRRIQDQFAPGLRLPFPAQVAEPAECDQPDPPGSL